MIGRKVTVTRIASEPRTTTPVGRSSETTVDTSDDAPASETGRVLTWLSSASWSASPSTVTTDGSATIVAISNPAAGVPVTSGVTVTDRLSRSLNTGIVTRAVGGDTSIGRTGFPTASTAMSGTS